MEKKKYAVFVSSTFEDLKDERMRVQDALLGAGYFPIGMEQFPADNDGSWDIIKEMIDESDYYVLIIGDRYGSIKKGTDKSFTELEYDYAVAKSVPVCAFWYQPLKPENKTDRDPVAQKRLEAFKEKVKKKQSKPWKDVADLISGVLSSLENSKRRHPRPGWIRGVEVDANPTSVPTVRIFNSNTNVSANNHSHHPTRRHPFEPEMLFVEGGTFWMGSIDGRSNEAPIHQVTLDSFLIGKCQVTQRQWKAVMGNNPSFYQEGNDYPVEEVNWNDVQEFCDRLNAATGKQYRLPTEAEWEYAARGGIYGRAATKPGEEDFLYSGSDTLGKVAWYGDISGRTHPVMKKDANELGLYDMSGNVWELCSDWYDLYPIKPQVNPQDPNNGYNRVARGGSWSDQAEYCRVACRLTSFSPLIGSSILGFRLALSASLPSGNNAG